MRLALRTLCLFTLTLGVTSALFATAATSPVSAQDNPLAELQRHQRELFVRVAPSVVFISTSEGLGSGFFVSDDGYIVTNAHVVGKDDQVNVVLHDGRNVKGKIVERSKTHDLALVKVALSPVPALVFAGMDNVNVGDWVGSVGHGLGGIWTFTTGMISNIYPDGHERPFFQTQIPLNPGNSGGPIFDYRGRVIGVVTAGVSSANSINFAIPMQVAMGHLNGLARHCDCLVIRAPAGVAILVDGVMVGTGPRVVVPAERRTYDVLAVIAGKPVRERLNWPETRNLELK